MKKILLALFLSLFLLGNVYSANIYEIEPVDTKSINISFSDDVILSEDNLDADIKVLKDLIVSYAYKDETNPKKVIINLTYDLEKNNTYSLIGAIGSDVNVDFKIGDEIPTEIVVDNSQVEKINLIDEKTLEVYYNEELQGDEFVYKVLMDLGTEKVKLDGDKILHVEVSAPLETLSAYIVLLNSLSGITFEETYHDFVTPDYLEDGSVDLKSATPEENLVSETDNSASVEEKKGNIEEVAMNTEKVPNTGTTTGILFLIAGLISGFFFLSFRKKK